MRTEQLIKVTQEEAEKLRKEEVLGWWYLILLFPLNAEAIFRVSLEKVHSEVGPGYYHIKSHCKDAVGFFFSPLSDLKNGKKLHTCDEKIFYFSSMYSCSALWIRSFPTRTNRFEIFVSLILLLLFLVASMARLLESQESQSRLIREYERTRDRTASQAMNE